MIKYATPEQVGIKSENIQKYIEVLEKNHLATHNIIMARGNEIFFEKYWKPFHQDFLHRMYSVSKSFVSLAIGFLEQDGLINLGCYTLPVENMNGFWQQNRKTVRNL